MAITGGSSKGSDDDTIRVAPKKESGKKKPNGTIKLKKPPPKHVQPGNWRDGSVVDDDKKVKGTDTPSTNSVESPGPVVNQLDDTARETFATGRPLEDSPDLQKCKHCKKSFLKTTAKAHVVACLKAKADKAQRKKEQKEARDKLAKEAEEAKRRDEEGDTKMEDDSDDDADGSPEKKGGIKTAKKSAGKNVEGKGGKKRKADGDPEKGPKQKKKKEEPKPKAPKPKGPVDVERQCGVLKDGVPCARSLTCKSHSMGAKRAVPGRSLPYDMLLAAYQKKNQAKQQKAAIDANAPLEASDEENGPIDSDEEMNSVMAGLRNWNPQPVVQPLNPIPIERQYQKARLYEQLHNATNGFTVNICKVVGYGAQKLPPGHPGLMEGGEDAAGEVDVQMSGMAQRRPSHSTFNMQQPPGRKSSGSATNRP